ncbi:MAG: Uma2 family endonuclease [Bacteroidetes bacterium]|nr:Uma2 family endonuclease [Bacteroidota bacterium]
MNRKYTYQDYIETPEGSAYQLLNGNLVCEPDAPYINHQLISGELFGIIREYVKKNDAGLVLAAPTDVYFDDNNTVQPDILYIPKERMHIIKEKYIEGPPGLVIEIVSQSTLHRDTVEKKQLYEKYGVKEYWLVFTEEDIIEVYSLQDNKYGINRIYEKQDTLVSEVIEGFKLEVKNVF